MEKPVGAAAFYCASRLDLMVLLSAELLFSVITGCSVRSICLRWAEQRLRLSTTDISSASFLFVTFHFFFSFLFLLVRTNGTFKDME